MSPTCLLAVLLRAITTTRNPACHHPIPRRPSSSTVYHRRILFLLSITEGHLHQEKVEVLDELSLGFLLQPCLMHEWDCGVLGDAGQKNSDQNETEHVLDYVTRTVCCLRLDDIKELSFGQFFISLTAKDRYYERFLPNGVVFENTFSYAGFEQQPKKFLTPKILLLNIELELKYEKEEAEIRLSDPL
uniref:Uncharacterized protein n=1 Tax=Oryza punctata TaxID=4537 RepID=A0A0E0M5R0_ORYPU